MPFQRVPVVALLAVLARAPEHLLELTDIRQMLDQRRLPTEVVYHRYTKPDEVAEAIRAMVVRGAPAIGISAAYALAQVAGGVVGVALADRHIDRREVELLFEVGEGLFGFQRKEIAQILAESLQSEFVPRLAVPEK